MAKRRLSTRPPLPAPDRRADTAVRAERGGWAAFAQLRAELIRSDDPGRAALLVEAFAPVAAALRAVPALAAGESPESADGLASAPDGLAALLTRRPDLPALLRPVLGELFADMLELDVLLRRAAARRATALPPGTSEAVRVPTSILYQLRRILLPAERMAVGAVRRNGEGYAVEAIYDVTEPRPTPTHVNADPDKLATALVDMDASGTFFGFWAHSQPGNSPAATLPSAEDRDTYAKRLAAGDSRNLVGAIVAGDYLRFFGAADRVLVVGSGLRPLNGREGGHAYAFER